MLVGGYLMAAVPTRSLYLDRDIVPDCPARGSAPFPVDAWDRGRCSLRIALAQPPRFCSLASPMGLTAVLAWLVFFYFFVYTRWLKRRRLRTS